MFFTDEKNFYLNPPVNNQKDHAKRLLAEHETFAKHVRVSAGVCSGGFVHVFEKTVAILNILSRE